MSGEKACSFAAKGCSCRPGWPEDWQELFGLIHDEGIVRNLASAPWPYTPEHAREFAASVAETGLPSFFVTLPTARTAPR
jgi:hypothetical protein